jgi:hypothetical protein
MPEMWGGATDAADRETAAADSACWPVAVVTGFPYGAFGGIAEACPGMSVWKMQPFRPPDSEPIFRVRKPAGASGT